MTVLKQSALTVLGLCLLTPLFLLLMKREITLTALSNSFFMLALLFFMIAAFIGIFISGFFDNFQRNMKNTLRLRKNTEPKEYLKTSEIFSKQPFYWLSVATSLLVISLILLLFI